MAFLGRIHSRHISLGQGSITAQVAMAIHSPPRPIFTGEYRIPLRLRRQLRRNGQLRSLEPIATSQEQATSSEKRLATATSPHVVSVRHAGDERAQAAIDHSNTLNIAAAELLEACTDLLNMVPQARKRTQQISSPHESNRATRQDTRLERDWFEEQYARALSPDSTNSAIGRSERPHLMLGLPSPASSLSSGQGIPTNFGFECECPQCTVILPLGKQTPPPISPRHPLHRAIKYQIPDAALDSTQNTESEIPGSVTRGWAPQRLPTPYPHDLCNDELSMNSLASTDKIAPLFSVAIADASIYTLFPTTEGTTRAGLPP
ncbi:MAG: hypothetical protein Q9227_002971 [Pyrenula ochraceoflavens]